MEQTSVDDFSVQWSRYTDHRGYFVSEDILNDIMHPFVRVDDMKDKVVAELGCGNGRFIKLMARVAKKVIAIEPGEGIHNVRKLCADCDNVEFVHAGAYDLPQIEPLDYFLSIGVIHHTPDPLGALKTMRANLKDGGRALIWVYGKEGNGLYLTAFNAVHSVTQRLPHAALHALSTALTPPLVAYIAACRVLPLPMRAYMRNVLGQFDLPTLRLTIYDQLNPKIANYWTKREVKQLMEDAGFGDVELFHRHGYSWTAVGTR